MTELMLLASEKIEDQKYYLYAIELKYQKIVKILKVASAEELSSSWKIGYVTEVKNFSQYTLDNSLYITSRERLKGEYENFTGLMLNKASYPDRIMSMIAGTSYAIVRLRNLKILDYGKQLEFIMWGTDKTFTAYITDPWWKRFWEKSASMEKREHYEKALSMSKKKVFGVIESKDSVLTVKKLIVQ